MERLNEHPRSNRHFLVSVFRKNCTSSPFAYSHNNATVTLSFTILKATIVWDRYSLFPLLTITQRYCTLSFTILKATIFCDRYSCDTDTKIEHKLYTSCACSCIISLGPPVLYISLPTLKETISIFKGSLVYLRRHWIINWYFIGTYTIQAHHLRSVVSSSIYSTAIKPQREIIAVHHCCNYLESLSFVPVFIGRPLSWCRRWVRIDRRLTWGNLLP